MADQKCILFLLFRFGIQRVERASECSFRVTVRIERILIIIGRGWVMQRARIDYATGSGSGTTRSGWVALTIGTQRSQS